MRAVSADVMARDKNDRHKDAENPSITVTMVSPLGNGVVEQDGPHNHKPKSISPYWGVILSPQSPNSKVNMTASRQLFRCTEPRLPNKKGSGPLAGFDLNLSIEMPVLINTTVLYEGDLLALPCNGGNTQVICQDGVDI